MKVSVIISIYQSYGVTARQVKYYDKMNLPSDVEFIFVDDGSEPPLKPEDYKLPNLSIYYTNNKLAWTQGLGRNLGASRAQGEYLLFTDIDHFFSREALEDVRNYRGSMMRFPRYFGVIDGEGNLRDDKEYLKEYGLGEYYLNRPELRTQSHLNTFAIPKKVFDELGGYQTQWCNYGFHPKSNKGDDCYFNGMWRRYAKTNNLKQDIGSKVYVFPNGRFHKDGEKNPLGLFHDLSHKQEKFNKND